MLFKDIVGQKRIIQLAKQAIKNNRVPHTQIITGAKGTGGLPLALAYAQYLMCENRGSDACGQCNSCLKVQKLIHPDLHFSYPVIRKPGDSTPPVSTDYITEWRNALNTNCYLNSYDWLQALNAENRQGNITVRECREIIRKLNLKSFEGGNKVLILWMPEYLGENGNVLLKLFEEPPSRTYIFMVTEDASQILNTILSRAQVVPLQPLYNNEIVSTLVDHNEISHDDATAIAHLSKGDYNEALQAITSDTGSHYVRFGDWIQCCLGSNGQDRLGWVNSISGIGRETQKHFLMYALHFFGECLHKKYVPESNPRLTSSELKTAEVVCNRLGFTGIEQIIRLIDEQIGHIERNANPRILFLYLTIEVGNRMMKEVSIENKKIEA